MLNDICQTLRVAGNETVTAFDNYQTDLVSASQYRDCRFLISLGTVSSGVQVTVAIYGGNEENGSDQAAIEGTIYVLQESGGGTDGDAGTGDYSGGLIILESLHSNYAYLSLVVQNDQASGGEDVVGINSIIAELSGPRVLPAPQDPSVLLQAEFTGN